MGLGINRLPAEISEFSLQSSQLHLRFLRSSGKRIVWPAGQLKACISAASGRLIKSVTPVRTSYPFQWPDCSISQFPCFWGKALWRSPGQQRDFCRQLAAGCTRVSAGSNARLILGITDYNLPLPHLEALLEALDRDLTDSQEAEGDDLLHKDTCRPLKID